MTAETGKRSVAELLDLVDAVIYADLFDSSATLDELHRYARVEIGRGLLASNLTDDSVLRTVVCSLSGAFTLVGREHLSADRGASSVRAARLRRRAITVGRVLRHAPFVRGILLTGSVSTGSAPPDADVDLLVIVAPDRIGTVFALLGSASSLVGRRTFCPNFYLSETSLELEPRDVYVGREIGQAQSIVGDPDSLRTANPWLDEMFPNLDRGDRRSSAYAAGSLLQRLLETVLAGRLGEWLEGLARRLAHARLAAHYTGDVPPEVVRCLETGSALRFHASGLGRSVPERYAARRADVASMFERARREHEADETAQAGRSS